MDLTGKKKQVQGSLRRGVPDGEIRESLRSEGFSEEEITEIFKPKPYDMRNYYLFFAVLFTLIGFYIMIAYQGWLVLVFAMLMYIAYIRECARVKRNNN